MTKTLICVALAVIAVSVGVTSATAAAIRTTAGPAMYKNCTALNKKYAHGVGTAAARDKTKSGDPVTNFLRSTRIYKDAIRDNAGLDRDSDKVACEKH